MFKGVTISKLWQDVLQSLFRREDSALPSWLVLFKRKYWEYKDYELGREHMGMDRYGNEYYQCYSYFGGMPTRRVVIYKFYENQHFHNDPHFVGWLNYRTDMLPSSEELQLLYLEDAQRKRKAIAWDEQQARLLEDAKERAEKITEKAKAKVASIGQGSMPGVIEDDQKVYKYIESKSMSAEVTLPKRPLKEHDIDLKVLNEIIAREEAKIQKYKEGKEEVKKHIETSLKEFHRYEKFKDKFKDVFLELEMDQSKENYSLIEKDPDIMITLKNL